MGTSQPAPATLAVLCLLLCGLTGVSGMVAAKDPRLSHQSRIIGGTVAVPGQLPSVVALYHHGIFGSKTFFCAGTLLDSTHVLTSAQCIKDYSATTIEIVAGETNLDEESGQEQRIMATSKVSHDYTTTTGANNIAILETSAQFTLIEGVVEAVPLPSDYQAPSGTCIAVGWGYTEQGGDLSADLRYGVLPFIPDEECVALYGPEHVLLDMMCAGETGGAGVCTYDSGGPLFCDGVQMGITPGNLLCDTKPTIFTEVSHFLDWIKLHS